MSIDWQQLEQILNSHQTFVISSHQRPDADALGSELTLGSYLERQGKTVTIINPGETPGHLQFLDPDKKVVSVRAAAEYPQAIQSCEVHVIVDTSAWSQLADVGSLLSKAPSKKVVIDHHVSSDDLSATEFKDVTSAATGCLIFDFLKAVGHPLTTAEAMALYAAIATDTGWFRFPSTTPHTMQIIAALIEAGAHPATLYRQLYEQSSLERLRLNGVALQRVQLACEGQLAYTYVMQNDFAQIKAHPADTENIVNECMRVETARAAFILVEQQNRSIKASLRAREGIDVARIAEQFGGGGHRLASGATITGTLETTISRLLEQFALQLPVPTEEKKI